MHLRASLHNHVNGLFERDTNLERIAVHLDPARCGLTFDTAHATKGGIADLGAAIPKFARHIVNVHVKDLAADGSFCPLGHGTLNLESVFVARRTSATTAGWWWTRKRRDSTTLTPAASPCIICAGLPCSV